jgi:3-oxoacyl-[acyl-carrier-protein] synthase III
METPVAPMGCPLARNVLVIGAEKMTANPYVVAPLKRTDCSMVSDGAAALVLSRESLSDEMSIGLHAMAQVNDYGENRRKP